MLMRRNFAQVLKQGNVNIKLEYSKLYSLFYDKDRKDGSSFAQIASNNITSIPFCGTCLSLSEFDQLHGFRFERQPQDFDIDYLVSFCEYVYNFLLHIEERFFFSAFNKSDFIFHIQKVIDSIGYMQSIEDGHTIFVPKNEVAISVAQSPIIPNTLSYKVISYNHHSMKGDLESKRQTLLAFADLIEPKRKKLEKLNSQLESNLFYAFNNCNIRHNNIAADGTKYKKPVADLTKEQLEQVYDDVYQMCLLAFMNLDYEENKKRIEELKSKIECK